MVDIRTCRKMCKCNWSHTNYVLTCEFAEETWNRFFSWNIFFHKLVRPMWLLADWQLRKSGAAIIRKHLLYLEQNAGAASQINRVNMWLLWDAVSDRVQRFPRGGTRWQGFYGWLATQTCSVLVCEASQPLRQTWPWREGPYYCTLAHVSLLSSSQLLNHKKMSWLIFLFVCLFF